MIEFDHSKCSDFDVSSKLEWLETNGIGGFACGTISGANTRRYHGLLTAATRPPLGRVTMLSKFEETLRVGDTLYPLSSNIYPGAIHPDGYRLISKFRLDPFPIWTFETPEVEIERRVFMIHGENSTVVTWSIVSRNAAEGVPVELIAKPLISFTSYHQLRTDSENFDERFEYAQNCVLLKPEQDFPEMFINHTDAEVAKTGDWYFDFEYPIEKERGFDYQEQLFQPFALTFDLSLETGSVMASTKQKNVYEVEEFEMQETFRREELKRAAEPADDFRAQLVLAADQFIVKRGEGETIIAGYPWFSDWGRDTMIALPGLTLTTNREGIAKNILREFSKHISEGMIPNRFPDEGEVPEYNTVDATLWYFEAIRAYLEKTGDYEFVESELYEKLVEIIYWHEKGTRFGIKLDDDGLLNAGVPGWQLTWMDAKYGDEVFTPRIGKPVEIQALWYNALETLRGIAKHLKDSDGRNKYTAMAAQTRKTFNRDFWDGELGYLYDFIDDDAKDASLRPNQIFAVSLKNSMVSMYRAKSIVQAVEGALLTPVGLRSLSKENEQYEGIYTGSPYQRDSSYHQGTTWGWLMGAFVESLRRTYPKGRKFRQYEKRIRLGFEKHIREHGVGQISEIFDGDKPFTPRGCFAQAWSVAELLRVFRD